MGWLSFFKGKSGAAQVTGDLETAVSMLSNEDKRESELIQVLKEHLHVIVNGLYADPNSELKKVEDFITRIREKVSLDEKTRILNNEIIEYCKMLVSRRDMLKGDSAGKIKTDLKIPFAGMISMTTQLATLYSEMKKQAQRAAEDLRKLK